MTRTSLKYVHKDQHAGKAEILVDGEVMDNALEAQEDEWYMVEFHQPDVKMQEFFIVRHRVDSKDVKIFDVTEDALPPETAVETPQETK
jgi:hypothetical protein